MVNLNRPIKTVDDLKQLQDWFSAVISGKMNEINLREKGVYSNSMQDEVRQVILPNKDLKAEERIEIYNQQYWFRLLDIMQNEYPILRHLWRIDKMNDILEEYLVRYPSGHYSLEHLGDRFHSFLNEAYIDTDKEIILEAANYEYSFTMAFIAAQHNPVNPEKLTDEKKASLAKQALKLQDHVFLHRLNYDFKSYRDKIIDDDDDLYFPRLLPKNHYTMIYRYHNSIQETIISQGEYVLLQEFSKTASIEEAIEHTAHQLQEKDLESIQSWFQSWIEKEILYFP